MGGETPIAREENEILIINFKNERTMKKFLFPALALGLVMTSCQSDEPFAPGMGEEVQATFTISVPDAMGTRAGEVNSALGGFSNGAGNLNYTVALLNQNDKVMYSETCQSDGKTATFHPTVVQGYTYKVVAYATFGNAVDPSAINEAFDGNDALASIATLKGISDESEDAYYCFDTEVLGGAEMSATLRRPFGKLRLVATDYDKLKALGTDVASVKVTYGENVVMETHFNAMAEAFGGKATSKEFEANKATYAEAANELTVFTDYLPASKTGETMYPFTIVTTYTNGETYTRTFAQDIPVKRNYLTTLRGDFFTTEAALTLKVEEMFANSTELDTKYTYFTVDTNDELKAALTSNHEHIYVELDANVTYDVAAWENSAMGGDKTKSITINGKQVVTRGGSYDKTLTFNQTNSDWNNIATKNGAKLILKNLNVTNSGRNDGPWNRHDLNFACDVEMDSVYSDKAIALKAGGVLKNVTINDKNTSDTYALWIQPKGQVVTLENCVIDMLGCTDGRGIKIDEQYLPANEVKAPTLYVSRTTFKTEEKAAVIVKSVDGAIINWREGNVISEVAEDAECAVWVDEASADYASKVVVNGASVRIEGSTVVKTADELVAALEANKGVYLLNDITVVATEGGYNKAGILQNKAQTIDGGGHTLTVTGAGATWDCAIYTNGGTIKNLTVAGAMRGIFMGGANADVYIDNVKFNNVIYTFNSDGGNKNYGVYLNDCIINGWTSHSDVHKEVVYTNCSFGEGNGYKFCRPYGPTSFVGCDFCEGFEIDAIGAVSFKNCTLNGVAITTENVGTLAPKTANVTVK